MSYEPIDLITISGREGLPPAERAALIAGELLDFDLHGPKWNGSNGRVVHAFNAMCGSMKAFVRDMGAEPIDPKSWGVSRASLIECSVLAWKRGGFEEHQRIKEAQRGAWRR